MPDYQNIIAILNKLNAPFWYSVSFWISTVIGLLALFFSILAFVEARKAKRAATEAGRTVKIQTITIELTEVSQRLDRLETEIPFNEARDLLNEISRRLRRIISPFQNDIDLQETITALRQALDSAKKSLNDVRPTDVGQEQKAPHAVYNAIEAYFSTINSLVADLLGLFEKKTINLGTKNGKH